MKHIFLYIFCFLSFESCAQHVTEKPEEGSGNWLLTLNLMSVGQVRVNMAFDFHENLNGDTMRFDAATSRGMDRIVFGFWKSEMARLYGRFKHGSLLTIDKGILLNNDSLKGVLTTPFGDYSIAAIRHNDSLHGVLKNSNQIEVGRIMGIRKVKATLENYPQLFSSILRFTQERIYDPKLLKEQSWQKFSRKMRTLSTHTSDDMAFLLGFYYYSHKYLPFSHFYLYRSFDTEGGDTITNKVSEFVSLSPKDSQTMYMKITSFSGSAAEMDSAFHQIMVNGYKNLIVDLRGNSGGSIVAGLTFAQHLVNDTLFGGIFLTQKYFKSHTQLPGTEQYVYFPHFSEANYSLLIKGIYEYPGICLMVVPKKPVFKGKVLILTDRQTASTCEPIVYGLKQAHRVTIVGEKTAGAMLTGENFPVGRGYTLTIPTATYYSADGYKIDQNGVDPDITLPQNGDALSEALQLIKSEANHE